MMYSDKKKIYADNHFQRIKDMFHALCTETYYVFNFIAVLAKMPENELSVIESLIRRARQARLNQIQI